jgi:hypothetical protein
MRLLLATVLLFAGCATHRNFAPRENRNGTGPGGDPAAVYQLGGQPPVGELRIWSRGADMVETETGDAVELHLGFELENTGSEPLAIDAGSLSCSEVWVDGTRSTDLPPARVAGEAEATPGHSAVLDAWFRPPAAGPYDLDGFSVRFRVRAGDRDVLVQVTPFVPYRAPDRWNNGWGNDPFGWYGGFGSRRYWGPAFGFGWYGSYWCR